MGNCDILATYSPKDIKIIISGTVKDITHVVNGYAEGEFVRISRVTPYSDIYDGGDDTNLRVIRNSKRHEVTLTLHQGSESNDLLSQLFYLDTIHRRNEYVFDITIKDSGGRTLFYGKNAFIPSTPDVGFGTEASEREWTIAVTCANPFHIGGNALFTDSTANTLRDLEFDVDDSWVQR